jgi:hypothetical protein
MFTVVDEESIINQIFFRCTNLFIFFAKLKIEKDE